MATVQPWHSKRVNDPEVYHDKATCAEGQQIAVYNRAPETAGRPRCEECSRLAQSAS